MGTFGALMGSLIAGLAYNLLGRNYSVTFSLSALPALGALLLVTTVSTSTYFFGRGVCVVGSGFGEGRCARQASQVVGRRQGGRRGPSR